MEYYGISKVRYKGDKLSELFVFKYEDGDYIAKNVFKLQEFIQDMEENEFQVHLINRDKDRIWLRVSKLKIKQNGQGKTLVKETPFLGKETLEDVDRF